MRYLLKHDLKSAFDLVAIPANSESKDFSLVRRIALTSCTPEAVIEGVRKAFVLGHHDEIIVDIIGLWNPEVAADNTVAHPFLDNVRVKLPVSR